MHRCVCLLLLILLLTGGCEDGNQRLNKVELERAAVTQKIELVEAKGGLVLMVGGDTLTSDEIINSRALLDGAVITPAEHFKSVAQALDIKSFTERARDQFEQILMDRISNIVLYQYARRQAGDNIDEGLERAAQSEYRRFVLGFGGDQAKADEDLERRGLDRKSFMERAKRQILTNSYVTSKLPRDRPVTYRELMSCYDEMKDEFFAIVARIRFRLIDIRPDKLEVIDPNQDRQQLAEKWAARLLARVESGEDFGELAKQHSHGSWRAFGGLWRPVQPTALRAPYDILAAEAEKMRPGQVTGPIVAAEHIFIMRLEEKQAAGYELFEAVQEQVREKIILDRQSEALEPLYAKVKRQAKLGRTDEFIEFCLEKIHRMSHQKP